MRLGILILFAFLAAGSMAWGAAPEVRKVEPPSWWAKHSIQPLRLMVRGSGFSGARVESGTPWLKAGAVAMNPAGTYLFVDVEIAPETPPGRYELRVATTEGASTIPLQVLPPVARAGRFQGVSEDDVLYLILPDRFANGDPANDDPAVSRGMLDRQKDRYYHGGDLRGIIEKLPYLKSLGVTAIWLNPWYDNVNHLNLRERYHGQAITDYHGYGAVDFYGVEEHLGTLETLRELVDQAHRAGIKVVQDQVANHTGPYHPWVADPPTPRWFFGSDKRHLANTWQTWTLLDPYATPQMRRATLEGWFIDILPDLNQGDPEVARYLIQNTLWWIGVTGIDAVRQDTVPYVPRAFWRDWTAAIRREFPAVNVIGEVFDGDPVFVSGFQGGRAQFDGVDSGLERLFDFPLFFPLRRAFGEGKPLREVAQMLARDRLYPNPAGLVTFLGLHDVDRFMNTTGATVAGLKTAFTLLMTVRGMPLIYYGDEIAMRGGGDPDNRRDFPGGWKGDARDAFEEAGRTAEEREVWSHVARLAKLRAGNAALRRGEMRTLAADDTVFAYARVLARREAGVVVLHNGKGAREVELEVAELGWEDGARWRDEVDGRTVGVVENGRVRVSMGAQSGRVILLVR